MALWQWILDTLRGYPELALFLFAVDYGVGPQFFRGLGKEGPKQSWA